jgi:hypothetical protein
MPLKLTIKIESNGSAIFFAGANGAICSFDANSANPS